MVDYQVYKIEVMNLYTKCAIELENCVNDEYHRLIEVEISKGETIKGVDICDYYYQPENKPKW